MFNVKGLPKSGARNALAVEVFATEKNDLGLSWVDWNPAPPDKDMGIWREVFLTSSGEVGLRAPFVSSKLDPGGKSAELNLSVELRNLVDHPVKTVLHAQVDDSRLNQPVELAAKESRIVSFTPDRFSRLRLGAPRLWWPYQMGVPHLYTARFRVVTGGGVSDLADTTFAIREVASELTDQGHRVFKVNGQRVLIRGAAWAPDLLLRWSERRVDADLAYVRHMGVNAIRLEGKLDRDDFFAKTDRLGILVMPGWICCDAWEAGARDAVIDGPAHAVVKAFDLPRPAALSVTYFLKLQLSDAAGRRVSDNFYWLSTKPDTMDWEKRRGTAYTPQKDYGNLSGLNSVPQVKLEVRTGPRTEGGDDNYFSLLPGEEKTVEARYARSSAGGRPAVVEITGYNIAASGSR